MCEPATHDPPLEDWDIPPVILDPETGLTKPAPELDSKTE